MDIDRLLHGFLGSGATASATDTLSQAGTAAKGAMGSVPGGLAGGAVAGGLMALVLGTKKGRKIGGKALKYGGAAALGGLAFKAYSDYRSKQASPATAAPRPAPPAPASSPIAPPPADSGFTPAMADEARDRGLHLGLVRAMISAANADGHIDAAEQKAIMEQIDRMGLGPDEKSFLFDQLRKPSDPIAIAGLAADEPQAAQLYLASLMAIDIDTPEERRYMERLGDALRLPEALRRELSAHAQTQ